MMHAAERAPGVPGERATGCQLRDRAVFPLRPECLRRGGVRGPDCRRAVALLRDREAVSTPFTVTREIGDVVEDATRRRLDRDPILETLHAAPLAPQTNQPPIGRLKQLASVVVTREYLPQMLPAIAGIAIRRGR